MGLLAFIQSDLPSLHNICDRPFALLGPLSSARPLPPSLTHSRRRTAGCINLRVHPQIYGQHPAKADLDVACLGVMDKEGPVKGEVTLEGLEIFAEGCDS